MRIVVDHDLCTGQGMCVAVAPDFFEVTDDGQSEVQVGEVPEARRLDAEMAVSCCPNRAVGLVP